MDSGHPAPPETADRTCPYCRVALEAGASVDFCTVCGAAHHHDCWEENSGCAVALCAGGPSLREEAAEPEQQAPPPPQAPPPQAAPPPGPAPPRAGGSRTNWIPLIAGVIVLLGGATAGAIVLTNHKDSSTTVEAAQTPAAEPEYNEGEEEFEGEDEGFESEEEGFEGEEGFEEPEPSLSPNQLATRQVQQALRGHFNRLANGQYHAAYRDLTPTEGEEIGGESSWVGAQEEDQLQSFELDVNTALLGSHSARARIVDFQTRSLATGCKDWSGYWEMSKVYGEWLISSAKLESEPC